jgi:hypothetical protein
VYILSIHSFDPSCQRVQHWIHRYVHHTQVVSRRLHLKQQSRQLQARDFCNASAQSRAPPSKVDTVTLKSIIGTNNYETILRLYDMEYTGSLERGQRRTHKLSVIVFAFDEHLPQSRESRQGQRRLQRFPVEGRHSRTEVDCKRLECRPSDKTRYQRHQADVAPFFE